jgi:AcrR family transcriptional regulator
MVVPAPRRQSKANHDASSRRGAVVRASPNGSPRTHVTEVQRSRVLTAAAQIVGELGYGGMSVARITGRAGVSRRTFYDLYEDREDCFLAAFEEAVARASKVAVEAAAGQGAWREQVRAGLSALLGFFDDEPGSGSLVVVEALGAGPRVLERRSRVLGILTRIVDEGRGGGGEVRPGREPSPLTAEGIVGAVLAVIHARILEKGHPRLLSLLNPLMGMIVLPYLGQAAAARELARPTPKIARAPGASRAPRTSPRDPLEGLDMRLTYRTLRVLSAIASHPGASNRHVADDAGVHDQGQISKLLARLEHLGLICNTGQGHTKGEANAWNLTPRGAEVEQSLRL